MNVNGDVQFRPLNPGDAGAYIWKTLDAHIAIREGVKPKEMPYAVTLYHALLYIRNRQKNPNIFKAGYAKLSKQSGLTKNTVKKYLETLKDLKLIGEHTPASKKGEECETRRFSILCTKDLGISPPDRPRSPADIPSCDTPITSDDTPRTSRDPYLYHGMTHISKKEESDSKKVSNKHGVFVSDIRKDGLICELRNTYPRTPSRPNEIKAIEKALTRVKPLELLERVTRYRELIDQIGVTPADNEFKLIPHFTTWLNQDRWEAKEHEWTAAFSGFQRRLTDADHENGF